MGMTKQYVEQLSESIGPRPVASDTERDGAEWIRTQFAEHGLNTTVQDFDTIRSLSGAHLLYAFVPLACVALLGVVHKWTALSWLIWIVILAIAVLAWLDFSGRGSLSRAFPKGPSQNVIGRYAPLAHPGEEPTKIVLVAHYDTDRSSPLASEGLATIGRLITKLAHGVIMLLPVFALVMVVPLVLHLKLFAKFYPYNWYALMILSIPVLLVFFDLLISQIMRRYSPGANNNASGVAAMLSICEDLAETINPSSSATDPDSAGKFGTGALGAVSQTSGFQPVATQSAGLSSEGSDFDTTFDFGVRPSRGSGSGRSSRSSSRTRGGTGTLDPVADSFAASKSSSSGRMPASSRSAQNTPVPAASDSDDAFGGYTRGAYGSFEDYDARDTFADTSAGAPVGAGSMASRQGAADSGSGASMDFGFGSDKEDEGPFGAGYEESLGSGVLGADIIGGAAPGGNQFTDSFGAVSPSGGGADDDEAGVDAFAAYAAGVSSGEITRSGEKKRGGLFGHRKKQKGPQAQAGDFGASDQPSDWLGVDTGYDAREEGRKIGSWDNFPTGGDDFDDGFSWKGGAAEGDLIEDEEYAATQAARIRRKISETRSSGFGSKELWFVATSAHYVHSQGIRMFLEDYHEDLRGALIINLASLGSGDLYWSIDERAGKTYKSSARLTATARRVARERNLRAKPYKKGALRTEAGWVLAEGRKAMSIVRLTPAGVPFAERSSKDVAARLSVEKIDEAVELVISLIQEL